MNCPNCHAENLNDATYCAQCGHSLQANTGSVVDSAAADAMQKKTRTYLIEAIVVTLCCCQIAGIVAIVYAALASGQVKGGNLAAAQDYATIARRWSIGGFAVGVLAWAAYFLFFIVGFSLQA